jgi:hypothetical protein
VIEVGQLAKVRRLHLREGKPIKEVSRQLGLSRNTVRKWLREPEMAKPVYPARVVATKLDGYKDSLRGWVKANAVRGPVEPLSTVGGAIRPHRQRFDDDGGRR